MKVDWDRIISENHNPSRVSRRVAKMLGGAVLRGTPGELALAASTFVGGPASVVLGAMISGIISMATPFYGDYESKYGDDYYVPTNAEIRESYNTWELDRLLAMKAQYPNKPNLWKEQLRRLGYEEYRYVLPEVDPIVEAAKEAKEQEEDRIIIRENETYAALLRNEQQRQDEAVRATARLKTTAAQYDMRRQAAQQSSAALTGHLARIQTAAATEAAARSQNLNSLHTLATQRGAVAAAEATQQKAIQANTAQALANQSAEMARLRAEAAAKQSQLLKKVPVPVLAAPPRAKIVRAPQVRFGGRRKRKDTTI
jgi:hypothetical protein